MFSLILSDTYTSIPCFGWTDDLLDVRDPTDDTVWGWSWTGDQWPDLMVSIDLYLWLQKLDINRIPSHSTTAKYCHKYEGRHGTFKITFTFYDVDEIPSKGFVVHTDQSSS
jgi:hypothetical protein